MWDIEESTLFTNWRGFFFFFYLIFFLNIYFFSFAFFFIFFHSIVTKSTVEGEERIGEVIHSEWMDGQCQGVRPREWQWIVKRQTKNCEWNERMVDKRGKVRTRLHGYMGSTWKMYTGIYILYMRIYGISNNVSKYGTRLKIGPVDFQKEQKKKIKL